METAVKIATPPATRVASQNSNFSNPDSSVTPEVVTNNREALWGEGRERTKLSLDDEVFQFIISIKTSKIGLKHYRRTISSSKLFQFCFQSNCMCSSDKCLKCYYCSCQSFLKKKLSFTETRHEKAKKARGQKKITKKNASIKMKTEEGKCERQPQHQKMPCTSRRQKTPAGGDGK